MANDVNLFNFNTHEIRVVLIEGNPWFVAADVCRALGLDTAKGTGQRLLGALANDEKRLVSRSNLSLGEVSFPNRGASCISESGLYKLVMRSDKSEARSFHTPWRGWLGLREWFSLRSARMACMSLVRKSSLQEKCPMMN